MATELDELIQYWKDRTAGQYPWTNRSYLETIKQTLKYLELLKKLTGGK